MRDSRERKSVFQLEQPWTIVNRRKSPVKSTPASKTCFIDFLPSNICHYDLAKTFGIYGAITNIHIPEKLRPNCQHRFAFIRFSTSESLERAIHGENGRKLKNGSLRVFAAKYDSRPPKTSLKQKTFTKPSHTNPMPTNKKPYQRPSYNQFSPLVDNRSYKDATITPNPNPPNPNPQCTPTGNPQPGPSVPSHVSKRQPIPLQDPEPAPDCFHFEPCSAKRLSSRLLGESVEKIRDELEVDKFEGEDLIAIKGSRFHGNDELFSRSIVAVSSSSQSSTQIHDHILAEGVTCITIKPIGGLQHLVTFSSMEDKLAIMESKWLENWFDDMREVYDSCAAKWKETWVKVYGVPIKSWSYENFFNIGNVFGRVLSIEYSGFEYARILLLTDCLFNINCKMIFQLEGKNSRIFVAEDVRHHVQPVISVPHKSPPPSVEESKGSDEDDINIPSFSTLKVSKCNLSSPHDKNLIEVTQPSQNTGYNINAADDCEKGAPIINAIITSVPSAPSATRFSPLGHKPNNDLHHQAQIISPPHDQKPPFGPIPISLSSSPITTQNRFGPLLPNTKPQLNSQTSSTSSLSSGPMFPPGFENSIPTAAKRRHAQKRIRKLQKKIKKKTKTITSSSSQPSQPSPSIITSQDVLKLASELGLRVEGPLSCIENLITAILKRQKEDWDASLQ